MLKNKRIFRKPVLLILALAAGLMVHAQTRTIQGTVTGATGEKLSGVTVSVPGNNNRHTDQCRWLLHDDCAC